MIIISIIAMIIVTKNIPPIIQHWSYHAKISHGRMFKSTNIGKLDHTNNVMLIIMMEKFRSPEINNFKNKPHCINGINYPLILDHAVGISRFHSPLFISSLFSYLQNYKLR